MSTTTSYAPIHPLYCSSASLLGRLRSIRMTFHLPKPLPPKGPPSNRVPLLRLALPKPPRHLAIRAFLPLASLVYHGWTKNKPDGSSGHTTVNRSLGFLSPEFLKGLDYAGEGAEGVGAEVVVSEVG